MAWYVYAGIVVANYVYHRLTAESPSGPKPANTIDIPKVKEGEVCSLIYGRCRVRQPVLAWIGNTGFTTSGGQFLYHQQFHMVLGIPFERTVSRLWNIWAGDIKVPWQVAGLGENDHTDGTPPAPFPGAYDSGHTSRYDNSVGLAPNAPPGLIGGRIQFYDGRGTQQHVEPNAPHGTTSWLGQLMKDDGIAGATIPGYRGYLSVVHFDFTGHASWSLGFNPRLPPVSYEVSSYPADSNALNVGLEANPAWVIVDLLTGTMGKLALPASMVDFDSFGAAAIRLQEEGNGYSRAIEAGVAAGDVIREILDQADGVIFHDPTTNKVKIKLIRPDYDPAAIPHITTSNCERLVGFSAGGFEGAPNKVVVVFSDRSRDYQEGSESAHNQAVAFAEGARELVLNYPGVCTRDLARRIASRELSARSRPLAKCTAIVNRSFYTVNPGDPVKLTWPEYGVDGRIFRVAAIDRGTLERGAIRLELIEDFFYVWRGKLPTKDPKDLGDLPPFQQV